jgi:hypothetical protein
VQEILAASMDTRELSETISRKLSNSWGIATVGEIAWKLLDQSWSMIPEVWAFVVDELNGPNALLCGAAALLLQRGKNVPEQQRQEAMARIRAILADEQLSRRPLDTPGGGFMRLDDVLFEALRALAE